MPNRIVAYFCSALFIMFCVNISGCDKESNSWGSCGNKFTKDMNFRSGIWKRSDVGGINNPQGFNFKNDSVMDILEEINPDVWKYNVKYRMKTCDSFQHNKYWIQPQEPSKEYWYSFVVKYLESTGEVEMSYYYNWDWESIRFKKE